MYQALAFVVAITAALVSPLHSKTPVESGFTPLFNGMDLSGWKVVKGKPDVWTVENGCLVVRGKGGGWLMSEKQFADFDLRFEFKLPLMGNSGVALRTPWGGHPAYDGMEIQLLDDRTWKAKSPRLRPVQYCGAIYDVVAPSRDATRPPGQWNQMRIVARGTKVRVELNGTTIIDADLRQYRHRLTEDKERKLRAHPGLLRPAGHLGFQSYNYRVEFRRIRIRDLSKG